MRSKVGKGQEPIPYQTLLDENHALQGENYALQDENYSLQDELKNLRSRLEDAEELKRAISEGDLDALVIPGPEGELIFTLDSADRAYRVLVETMNEGTATLTFDGTILYCNRQFAELLKMPLHAIVGTSIYRFIAPENAIKFKALLKQEVGRGEINFRAGEGTSLPVYLSVSSLQQKGSPNAWCLVATDLTEQKKNDEIVAAELLARSIIEQAAEAIVVCDTSGRITHFSNAMPKLCGCDPTFRIFENLMDVQYSEGENAGKSILPVSSALKGLSILGVEATLELKDCNDFYHKYYLLLNSGPLKNADGEIIGCVVTFTDITERKRGEKALQESEERFRTLVAASSEVLYRMSPDWSEMRQLLSGRFLASTERPNRNWVQGYIPLDDQPHVTAVINEAIRAKSIFELEHRVWRADGSLGWTFSRAVPLTDANGEIVEWFGSASDITERKRVEIALQESEEKYKTFFENSIDAVLLTSPDGTVYAANSEACRIFEMTEEEIIQAGRDGCVDASDPRLKLALEERTRTGKFKGEINYKRKDGTTFPGEVSTALFIDNNGLVKATMIIRDITERKQLEEQTRRRAEELATVMETAPVAIWIGHDPQSHDITGNRMANEFYEAEIGENVSANVTSIRRFFYKGRELTADELPMQQASLKDIDVRNAEFDVLLPSGEWRTLLGSASPFHDSDGCVRGSVGAFIDITERKRTEEKLLEAYEQIQTQSEKLGIFNEELKTQSEELREANEALSESEKRFRTLAENSPDIIARFDRQKRHMYANPSVAGPYGRSPEEIIGKTQSEMGRYSEQLKFLEKHYENVFATGKPETVEFRYISPQEKEYYLNTKIVPEFVDGKVTSVLAISRDIKDIKEAEAKLKETLDNLENLVQERTLELEKAYNSLKESERGLAEAQKMAHIGNWYRSLKTDKIYWSDEVYRIFGFKPQEIGITYDMFLSYVHPDDRNYLRKVVKEALNGKPSGIDYRVILAEGTERIVHEEIEAVFDKKKTPIEMRGTVQDITERKRAEEALEKIEKIRIKEIHHRIKNNLQVISSLLSLEAERFSDEKMLEALRESQNRVTSMALIHEELYKGGKNDSVDFAAYLQKLTADLFSSYNLGNDNINLKMDLDQVYLEIDTAIPLGIIVNELVSNSLKHAFPAGGKGEININLCKNENFAVKCNVSVPGPDCMEKNGFYYALTVTDNGKGIPEEIEFQNADSLGLQLINILVEQIDGCIELKRNNGTKFTIWFSNIE